MPDSRPPLGSFFNKAPASSATRPPIESFSKDDTAAPKDLPLSQGGLGQKVANFFTGGLQQFSRTAAQASQAPGNADKFTQASQAHSDIENNLQKAIEAKKKSGGDTTLLDQALKQHQLSAPKLQDFTGSVINKSGGQIAGEALGAGIDVAGLGVGDAAEKTLAKTAGEDLVKEGAKAGAKVGSIFGAGSGLSQGLQNKDSAGNLIKDTAISTIAGAATGGTLGAAGGKLASKFATKSTEALEKEALDVIAPKLTDSEKESAAASGKAVKKGRLGAISVEPSAQDKKSAKVVSNIVQKGKTYTENISAVKQAIVDKAEELKTKIGTANHPFTFKDINARLNTVEKPITIKSDATLNRQFDLVKDSLMKIIRKNGGDISSLLDSRKEFDALVEKEFPELYAKENAPMRNAVTAMRQEVNDFIEENLPAGVDFKQSLSDQSSMYHAIDNMATNAKGEIGTNFFTRFPKKYPKTATAIGTAAALGVGEKIKNTIGDLIGPKAP